MNKSRQEILKEVAATHRANIKKSLEHRMEVARAQGNEELLRQLEAEANYFS
ncbi:MAG: hypothetical protein N3E45_01500 [Oscillatoriaceae bacterium SKW80]|nr:hypothetical protein [Oscillatoriaceae bacterium SKYG93]MCX8119504.1 hypothetical protein [Oscillatoriaceae bacterium SKW80]MDW8454971.1 hypothetical protein [Oscillatoriaceae cyanobacterium SKYGB_i_bin93]HIK28250.1 hypothetical protein [Oscillatoriaceae cyanobacterium M7585_C2015_266]